MKSLPIWTFIVLSMCGSVARSQSLEPGLIGRYYNIGGHFSDFPESPLTQSPNVKRVDATLDFPLGDTFRGVPFRTHFYVEWTGKIRISKPDVYTFTLDSDDGAEFYIYDRKIVDNGGAHSMRAVSGTVDLPIGDLDIKIRYFQASEPCGCRFFWQTGTMSRQIVPAEVLFHSVEQSPMTPVVAGPGLVGSYYQIPEGTDTFPQFEIPETPDLRRVDGRIDFPTVRSFQFAAKEYFYVNWTGRIKVEKSGVYTFFLQSDDGSRLYLDDKLVVDHGGLHRMKEKHAAIELTSGQHRFKMDYFQSAKEGACRLLWEGPDLAKETISESVFTH